MGCELTCIPVNEQKAGPGCLRIEPISRTVQVERKVFISRTISVPV